MWEANGQQTEVALYVRSLAAAERANAPVTMRTLVRQQMDALGLTIPGLRSNRWTIDDAPSERRSPEAPPAADQQETARERLKLVMGGQE